MSDASRRVDRAVRAWNRWPSGENTVSAGDDGERDGDAGTGSDAHRGRMSGTLCGERRKTRVALSRLAPTRGPHLDTESSRCSPTLPPLPPRRRPSLPAHRSRKTTSSPRPVSPCPRPRTASPPRHHARRSPSACGGSPTQHTRPPESASLSGRLTSAARKWDRVSAAARDRVIEVLKAEVRVR